MNGHDRFRGNGEASHVIEAREVIHVRMRDEHRIEAPDVFAQALGAEVRPGVHDPGALRRLQVDRGTQALVPGIGGAAGLAVAADHGHAHGGAGAEEGEGEAGHRS